LSFAFEKTDKVKPTCNFSLYL